MRPFYRRIADKKMAMADAQNYFVVVAAVLTLPVLSEASWELHVGVYADHVTLLHSHKHISASVFIYERMQFKLASSLSTLR